MKIGVCAGPEQLPLLESLGFDYFEANFSWLAGLDEETYREKTALVETSALRAEAFNGFFPGGIKLYSPDGNQDDILPRWRPSVKRASPAPPPGAVRWPSSEAATSAASPRA